MAFHCRDCSYTAKQFPGGACPACGSRNARSQAARPDADAPARSALRPVILVVVWGIFLVLLYRRFSGN
jgi:hypothetical protein